MKLTPRPTHDSRGLTHSRKRPGFTLLEVILASVIAVLLMGALYFSMDMILRETQESRDAVDSDNLARGAFNRFALDLSGTLAPLPPKSGGNAAIGVASSSSSTSGSTSSSSTSSSASSTSGSSTAGSSTTGSTTGSSTTGATPSPEADLGMQAGIIGTDKQLTIYASRLPMILARSGALIQSSTADSSTQNTSDLVRITYWLGQSGGLCRQERPWVTSLGVMDFATPDQTDEPGDTLIDEVKDVTFEYFDGSSWQSSWDGSILGPDGVTPQGPPRALRVTLTYQAPGAKAKSGPVMKTVVQVVPIRAAPGLNTPTMIIPDSDPGTTGSSSSSGTASTSSSSTSGNSSTTGSAASTPASVNSMGAVSSGSNTMSGTKSTGSTSASTPSATPASSSGTKSSTTTPSTTSSSKGS